MSAPDNEELINFVLLTSGKQGKRPLSELTLQTEKRVSTLQNNKINVYWGPAELTATMHFHSPRDLVQTDAPSDYGMWI